MQVQEVQWYVNITTTDTQWRHKSKISEKLGRCGRQNMLPPYLKIWDWDWIFGRAMKAISSLGVRSPWVLSFSYLVITVSSFRNRSIFKSQSTHILHIKIACKFLQIPIQSAFFCKFIDPQWNQTRFEVPFFSFMHTVVVWLLSRIGGFIRDSTYKSCLECSIVTW